jgi:hypothetical protein
MTDLRPCVETWSMSKWFLVLSQVAYLLRSLRNAHLVKYCMVGRDLLLGRAEGAVDNDVEGVSFLAIVKTTIVLKTH